MAGAQAAARIPMKVLVEEDQVTPNADNLRARSVDRLRLAGTIATCVGQEDAREPMLLRSSASLLADSIPLPGTCGTLDPLGHSP